MILPNLKKDEGFTFIETLIVLAIMMVLSAGIGVPAMQYIERAKKIAAKTQIETFRTALQSYYLDCSSYPTKSQGLGAVFEKPLISPVPEKWCGPYIDRKLPEDPWGNPYAYCVPGEEGLPYSIISYGADKREGGTGNDADIFSWK